MTRAFSLLEVIIAIAILVLLAGLVGPACMSWIGIHRFQENLTTVESTLGTWRARSERDGIALVISAHNSSRGMILAGSIPSSSENEKSSGSETSVVELRAIFDGLEIEVLDNEVSYSKRSSESTNDGMATEQRAFICVILPDGSTSGPRSLVVHDRGKRVARGAIDRWSGEIAWSFERSMHADQESLRDSQRDQREGPE